MHTDCFPPVNNEPMIIYLSWGVQNQDEHTLQCETYPNRSIISHIDPYAKMDTLERYVVPQHRALKKEFPMRSEMQLSQQNDFSSLCFADEIPVFFREILSCTAKREQNSHSPVTSAFALRSFSTTGQPRSCYLLLQTRCGDGCREVQD